MDNQMMFPYQTMVTPVAPVAAVAPFGNGNNGNNNGLGGGGMDWLILLLLLFGQGRNGMFGGAGAGTVDGITNEFQMTHGKLDSITASTNAGFANTQMGFAAVAQQLAACCCDIQLQAVTLSNDTNRHIDNINFTQTIANTANTQRIVDRVDALQDAQNLQRIRDLETQLGACNTRDTVLSIVQPIGSALASIQAQLNCGVKSFQYSPSLPVWAGPPAPPFAFGACAPGGFGGYPFGGGNCGPCNPGYGNQGF